MAGTTETAVAEGELLEALRRVVGPNHWRRPRIFGHITPRMLNNTDICIARKENHHSDFVECGQKVAELLIRQLDGWLIPVTVSAPANDIAGCG
ncbi:MAG: hypothetical protein EOQ39_33385 [Mesorhizobium sp.]|nr:M81 family metallopeptidase [Mesorhizobium sp.]RWA97201.1 MAG: hypothetical protein EOQ37_35160 [Mesorhizobium sp.]RWB09537.1 MAG: hypothetical protein EOQ39_33385 [Mesorhizobium sp.]